MIGNNIYNRTKSSYTVIDDSDEEEDSCPECGKHFKDLNEMSSHFAKFHSPSNHAGTSNNISDKSTSPNANITEIIDLEEETENYINIYKFKIPKVISVTRTDSKKPEPILVNEIVEEKTITIEDDDKAKPIETNSPDPPINNPDTYEDLLARYIQENDLPFIPRFRNRSDGNCWYEAIADQIVLHNIPDLPTDHEGVRKAVCDALFSLPQTKAWIKNLFGGKKAKFISFVNQHRKNGEWTDAKGLMCQATALWLKRNIHIVGTANANQPVSYTKLESVPLADQFKPLNVGYYQDKHYQSLEKIETDQDESANGTIEGIASAQEDVVINGENTEHKNSNNVVKIKGSVANIVKPKGSVDNTLKPQGSINNTLKPQGKVTRTPIAAKPLRKTAQVPTPSNKLDTENPNKTVTVVDRTSKATNVRDNYNLISKASESTNNAKKQNKTLNIAEKVNKTPIPADKPSKTLNITEKLSKTSNIVSNASKTSNVADNLNKTTNVADNPSKTTIPADNPNKTLPDKPNKASNISGKLSKTPNIADNRNKTTNIGDKRSKTPMRADNPNKTPILADKPNKAFNIAGKLSKTPNIGDKQSFQGKIPKNPEKPPVQIPQSKNSHVKNLEMAIPSKMLERNNSVKIPSKNSNHSNLGPKITVNAAQSKETPIVVVQPSKSMKKNSAQMSLLARRNLLISSAIKIQKWFRTTKVKNEIRKRFLDHRQAAIKIQRQWRSVLARKLFLKKIRAVLVIQRAFRWSRVGQGIRKEFLEKRRAVLTLQKHFRLWLTDYKKPAFELKAPDDICMNPETGALEPRDERVLDPESGQWVKKPVELASYVERVEGFLDFNALRKMSVKSWKKSKSYNLQKFKGEEARTKVDKEDHFDENGVDTFESINSECNRQYNISIKSATKLTKKRGNIRKQTSGKWKKPKEDKVDFMGVMPVISQWKLPANNFTLPIENEVDLDDSEDDLEDYLDSEEQELSFMIANEENERSIIKSSKRGSDKNQTNGTLANFIIELILGKMPYSKDFRKFELLKWRCNGNDGNKLGSWLEKKAEERTNKAVLTIQSHWRSFMVRRNFMKRKNAANKIKQWFRAVKYTRHVQQEFTKKVKYVVTLQANCRRFIERRRFIIMKENVVKIQSVWKMIQTRRYYIKMKEAVLLIQGWFRKVKKAEHFKLFVPDVTSSEKKLIDLSDFIEQTSEFANFTGLCKLATENKTGFYNKTVLFSKFQPDILTWRKDYTELNSNLPLISYDETELEPTSIQDFRPSVNLKRPNSFYIISTMNNNEINIKSKQDEEILPLKFVGHSSRWETSFSTKEHGFQIDGEYASEDELFDTEDDFEDSDQQEHNFLIENDENERSVKKISKRGSSKKFPVIPSSHFSALANKSDMKMNISISDWVSFRCKNADSHEELNEYPDQIKAFMVARKKIVTARDAPVKIQRWFRNIKKGRVFRDDFLKKRIAATKIQSHRRSFIARRNYKERKLVVLKALKIIQSHCRSMKERKQFLRKREAAIKIQKWYRHASFGKAFRKKFLAKKKSAMLIQSRWKGGLVRQEFRKLMVQRYNELTKKVGYIIKIQRWYRNIRLAKQVRKNYLKQQKSIVILQANFRSMIERRRFSEKKKAAITFQSQWKAILVRRQFTRKREAAVKIQRWFRNIRLGMKVKEQFAKQKRAAITLQACWRGFLGRKTFKMFSMINGIIEGILDSAAVPRKVATDILDDVVEAAMFPRKTACAILEEVQENVINSVFLQENVINSVLSARKRKRDAELSSESKSPKMRHIDMADKVVPVITPTKSPLKVTPENKAPPPQFLLFSTFHSFMDESNDDPNNESLEDDSQNNEGLEDYSQNNEGLEDDSQNNESLADDSLNNESRENDNSPSSKRKENPNDESQDDLSKKKVKLMFRKDIFEGKTIEKKSSEDKDDLDDLYMDEEEKKINAKQNKKLNSSINRSFKCDHCEKVFSSKRAVSVHAYKCRKVFIAAKKKKTEPIETVPNADAFTPQTKEKISPIKTVNTENEEAIPYPVIAQENLSPIKTVPDPDIAEQKGTITIKTEPDSVITSVKAAIPVETVPDLVILKEKIVSVKTEPVDANVDAPEKTHSAQDLPIPAINKTKEKTDKKKTISKKKKTIVDSAITDKKGESKKKGTTTKKVDKPAIPAEKVNIESEIEKAYQRRRSNSMALLSSLLNGSKGKKKNQKKK